MKKVLAFVLPLLLALPGRAQDRIYIATDRSAYVAGDLVYCSLFCVDNQGLRSGFSAVSYLELISAEGTAAEAKIGLFDGRGAGCFRIPAQVPTGNYRLVAYTARSQAVPEGSRILAVYNTSSTARVPDGVRIVPEKDYQAPSLPADLQAGIGLSFPARVAQKREVPLILTTDLQGADVSVSVFHEDALAAGDGNSLSAFLGGRPAAPGNRSGEYEGEIIQARVEGLEMEQKKDDEITAFLSSAGDPSNVYIGRSNADGHILFFTDNIYGDRELVCEVVSMQGRSCHISLASPFTHPDAGELPVLDLSPAQRSALVARKASLREQAPLDTLVQFLPKREGQLFSGSPRIRYHLDDYNRFPTIREICIEFAHELQFVRRDGRWRIRMMVSDGTSSRRYVLDNILVLMDGVVITDHGMLEDFDAMLLEDIDIYRQPVAMGGVSYNGVVNFISKRNYVTALRFPENVRVVDFRGVSYPVAYPGEPPQDSSSGNPGEPSQDASSGNPSSADRHDPPQHPSADRRQLLYWHPALEIPAQSQARIPLHMPAYPGTFRVVVEGWAADGSPLRAEYSFSVE